MCQSVHPSTFSNISYETIGPMKLKFHVETPLEEGTKVCSNGPGHMTKMAAMPIYGKNHLLQKQKADDFGTWYEALGM